MKRDVSALALSSSSSFSSTLIVPWRSKSRTSVIIAAFISSESARESFLSMTPVSLIKQEFKRINKFCWSIIGLFSRWLLADPAIIAWAIYPCAFKLVLVSQVSWPFFCAKSRTRSFEPPFGFGDLSVKCRIHLIYEWCCCIFCRYQMFHLGCTQALQQRICTLLDRVLVKFQYCVWTEPFSDSVFNFFPISIQAQCQLIGNFFSVFGVLWRSARVTFAWARWRFMNQRAANAFLAQSASEVRGTDIM